LEFDYDGGGPGQGGTATLYVDGGQVAAGRVDNTVPGVFSADETTDVGTDTATGVTDDLDKSTVKFTGEVKWVQIDLGDAAEDFDHMVTPEERYRIAMARQ
jgi:arylsulfatase